MNNVKNVRKAKGLSQTELAFKVGVSQRYISFIEAGKRKPSLDLACKLAQALETTVDFLFLPYKCT